MVELPNGCLLYTSDLAYKARTARTQLIEQNGKEPTVEEIAARMELPVQDVVFALESIQDPISLFEPVYNTGGDTMIYVMDQISDTRIDVYKRQCSTFS